MPDPEARLADGWRIEPIDVERDLDGVMAVDGASFANAWTRDMFLHEAQGSQVGRILVLRAPGGQVAGYCAFWVVAGELHVNNLAVGPAWRRQGLGALLLGAVLGYARADGAARATLEVRASNTAALGLYRRFGFAVVARRPAYYTSPIDDALILWRDQPSPSP